MSLVASVESTLTELSLASVDGAAAALALHLAGLLDDPSDAIRPADIRGYAAELSRILAELGATPASRARIASHSKSVTTESRDGVDSLAAFRARKIGA